MKTAFLWMLITVTGGGTVGHSTGYPGKHYCEEARSIALYGRTLEEEAAAAAAYEKAQYKREAAFRAAEKRWFASHPCLRYEPKEKALMPPYNDGYEGFNVEYKKTPHGYWCPVDVGGSWSSGMVMISTPEAGGFYTYENGQAVTHQASDVKTAECVIENGSDEDDGHQNQGH